MNVLKDLSNAFLITFLNGLPSSTSFGSNPVSPTFGTADLKPRPGEAQPTFQFGPQAGHGFNQPSGRVPTFGPGAGFGQAQPSTLSGECLQDAFYYHIFDDEDINCKKNCCMLKLFA